MEASDDVMWFTPGVKQSAPGLATKDCGLRTIMLSYTWVRT